MLKSMTGYGKAEADINGRKYIVEIRSLNGKSADISLKTQLIPREKEMEVRQYLTGALNRGTIDLFITVEREEVHEGSATLNQDVLVSYLDQLHHALRGSKWHKASANDFSAPLLASVIKMPDVFEVKREELGEDGWEALFGAIREAAARLNSYRVDEGVSLKQDILSKVDMIESCIPEIEGLEAERISAVRERILGRIGELSLQVDQNRLEQEIIFYVDKLDINEEKVRLRQHCRYLRETMETEEYPGKKLGFIAQEMGREINTLGSKASHAGIQKTVVRMKAELEKIKEQSMNVL
jgi:uncharacterized protein (TIGR00255 family)